MSNPLRPRRFDLIAFDWDGTLYDSTRIIVRCIQNAVVDVGGQLPSDEQAAYAAASWLQRADRDGSLSGFIKPSLTADEREQLSFAGRLVMTLKRFA